MHTQATGSDDPVRPLSSLNEMVGTAFAKAIPTSCATHRRRLHLLIAGAICVLFAGPGCISLGTYNSPQTMPEGSGSVGAGTAIAVSNEADGVDVTPLPAAYGRIGLGRRIDAGLKVAPFVLFADLKYQFLDRRIDVAADFGVSYGVLLNTVGAYPALYIGTDRFYVGGRLAAVSGSIDSDESSLFNDATFSGVIPGVVVGASIGDRVRVRPEVNVHFSTSDGSPLVLPGIGFQYRLGKNQ